jgi:uncharacterized protein YjaZ
MNIKALRSDKVYKKIMQTPEEEKIEMYRHEMLEPFMGKWNIQHIPFRANVPGGFDVIMLNDFAYLPPPEMIKKEMDETLSHISTENFWNECESAVSNSLSEFTKHGISLKVNDYIFTILLGNPNSRMLLLSDGYTGDGGIPGYIIAALIPNPTTLARIKPALAHECNHNVRYQFIQWTPNVTLGEMIIGEGLAECFATSLYGDALVGPWVSKTDIDVLNQIIKPKIKENLSITGMMETMPYLYGDEIAALRQLPPVGLPYAAGYACGYYLVKKYLQNTGKSILEATLTPSDEILKSTEEFWDEKTVINSK